MPKHIPHFYLSGDLPDQPAAYIEGFRLEPLKDLKPEKDLLVLVLRDDPQRTGRITIERELTYKTYTGIWKAHNTVILKGVYGLSYRISLTIQTLDLRGAIETSSNIRLRGEIRIWKRGKPRSQLMLSHWTDVFDQALLNPDVDWLVCTTPTEAVVIEYTWASVLICLSTRLSSYRINRARSHASSVMFLSRRMSWRHSRQCHLVSAHLIMYWRTMAVICKQAQGQKICP